MRTIISFFLPMLELPHTIVGAAIAVKIGNPALALPLALASHFVVDALPHWNPHLNREIKEHGKVTGRSTAFVAIDAVGSLVAGFGIASTVLPDITHFWVVILACFMAVLPDVVEAPYFFLRKEYAFVGRLIAFQKSIQNDAPPLVGLTTQAILVAAALWWVFS